MSTANDNKRQQLVDKLKEMFQMDQADLDFGIYRIMNAKRDEISQFLEQDLLPTLRTTLQEFQPAGQADKHKELVEAIANAKKLKIDPDSLEVVLQLKAELAESGDLGRMEDQVYSDLYTFFSRYYQDGDFLSLRRYKEGVYAMPYEGEEVKLHWANADQYYIKTAENFTRYAFRTEKGRVRFELTLATTERDNVKASADNERRFVLAAQPLKLEGNELVIRFEYRPDDEKRKQKELNTVAIETLLALPEGTTLTREVEQWMQWRAALSSTLPTDKNKSRTLLEKHLTDYTAKNTFDYFIHKDLGRFLRREMDFFIKNEVIRLDDVENESSPKVESYLARIKATRRIAHKLIDFLAQLENFQKRLWLKKKFILETQWLFTLNRIPEELYTEVCEAIQSPVRTWVGTLRSQREEWNELFALNDNHATDQPLTGTFFKENPFLVLDTAYLGVELKWKLLSAISNIDDETNGTLVHGENFQALSLLREKYQSRVSCIYIDPPYNTGDDGFAYKDNYKESSWLALMQDRLSLAKSLMTEESTISSSIDDEEIGLLQTLLDTEFGRSNRLPLVTVKRGSVTGHKVINPGVVKVSDFLLSYAKDKKKWAGADVFVETSRDERYSTYISNFTDESEKWRFISLLDAFAAHTAIDKRKLKGELGENYERLINEFVISNAERVVQIVTVNVAGVGKDFVEAVKKSQSQPEKVIHYARQGSPDVFLINGKKIIFYKEKLSEIGGRKITCERASDIWLDVLPNDLHNEGGVELKKGKKPEALLARVIEMSSAPNDLVLDFFCGSGSFAAAAHKMGRVWLGVENSDYFDSKTLLRMKNVLSGEGRGISKKYMWQGGGMCKYIRLESYEDTCGNLTWGRDDSQQVLLDSSPTFREDYVLKYMLDVESRASLLNMERFNDPFNVEMVVTRNDESRRVKLDLVETFNYLLGLRVVSMRSLKGVMEVTGSLASGERVLVLWRNTQEVGRDELDNWFKKQAYNSRDQEFDLIFVNGDNNIENLRLNDETWKVRLTEEAFHALMFTTEGL